MNFPTQNDFIVAQNSIDEWTLEFVDPMSIVNISIDEPIEIYSIGFHGAVSAAEGNNQYVGFNPFEDKTKVISFFHYYTGLGVAQTYMEFHNCKLKLQPGSNLFLWNSCTGSTSRIVVQLKRVGSILSEPTIKKCDLINWILGRCD